ncbi:FtsX-like permease family protein [Amycolatopsis suaedae]|uniref:ABC transporter permease n=1 Tax=Amycolatopsis suaedae TaxID=2510978 RepID=A0A4Q7JD62_9PSEU|nr:FtsX-like permease family protein [Amycolatopsis suaedae]RZQ65078.1 ABC transporter permease [Amycolatopsis suaedae]
MNPVQLALRVLRGDRRTRTSAILTAVGVAVATALVLLLVSLPFATEARSQRGLWQEYPRESTQDSTPTLALAYSKDFTGDRQISRVDVARLADVPHRSLPPGIDRLPEPGEVLLSPELAQLASKLPASQLSDRFGGKVVGVLGQDALTFPEQLVALVGQTPQSIGDNAVPVPAFPSTGAQVDPYLQLLSGVGIVVLLVPSLVLVASAARLTAARREQRLAALRLAGATPGQVTATVAAETAIAAVAGAVLGVAAGPGFHLLASLVPWAGGTWQTDDFVLPVGVTVAIAVAIPALVVLAAVLGLRRVVRQPLGAASSHARRPLHWWRLLVLPVAGLLFALALIASKESGAGILPVLAGLALLVGSAAVVGPWVTSAVGGIFVKLWRRPAALLAGRRLRDDPRGAYRASAGVVLAVFAGSMALTLLPSLESLAGGGRSFQDSVLYIDTSPDKAAQVAEKAGAELDRYGIAERPVSIPQVSLKYGNTGQYAMVMPCADAARLTRLVPGAACTGGPAIYSGYPVTARDVTVSADYEQPGVPLTPGTVERTVPATDSDARGAVIVEPSAVPASVRPEKVTVAVQTTPASREVVRTALVGAANGEQIESRELHLSDQQTQLADLRRVTVIGLVAAGLLAGCSAAIATAGSVMDRRRTFGALLAAGTPVRTLARALRTEAALPAMVATIGAGVVGAFVGLGLFSIVDSSPVVISPWILAPVGVGALVAVLAASVCTPALKRVQAEPLADE